MCRALALLFFLVPLAVMPRDIDAKAALDRLDDVLERQEVYLDSRQAYIDSLGNVRRGKNSPELLLAIAEAYKGYNNDSAIVYLRSGARMTEGIAASRFRWRVAALLPLDGFFDQAIRTYNSVDADSVPAEELPSYYDSGRQMYSYISAFFRDYPETAGEHKAKALEMQRKLLDVLPDGSREKKFNLGEYYYLTGSNEKARMLLEEFVDTEPESSNLRARAAHHLFSIAKENGDNEAAIGYLAMSAISDILSATREVASLQELGNEIYSSGDILRAYNYLSAALEKAVVCGAPLRMVETAKFLPIIERAHSSEIASGRRMLYWVMAGMALLVIVLLLMLLFVRHEMAKMRRLQQNLRAANTAKEVYISQFLNLCSIYMDKLNQFCKVVTRKITAGQTDELYRMARSGKFVEEQSKEFYEVFDNAFLHIYPDFIEQVNALLRPECRFEKPDDEKLNTDLRILAFMRLGIDESPRIAQVLNYSLNTIYSYRNRLKSRAINRDTFESDVMKIDSHA